MFPSAKDLPAIIAFILPGFVTLGVLDGLRGPAKRSQLEWIGQSLLLSLGIYWVVFWVTQPIRGTTNPQEDPLFQFLLIAVGAALAFGIYGLFKAPILGPWLENFWDTADPKIWDDMFDPGLWVQVQLEHGPVIFGRVSISTNDPNEERLELYLEDVQVQDEGSGQWVVLKGTEGVYLPGDQISWVQRLLPGRGSVH
jgi:hypothetical protein